MAADGITPGPKEQGYVARRLVRRALAKANSANISKEKLISCVQATQNIYGPSYEAILNPQVIKIIGDELQKFDKMLIGGSKQIVKEIKDLTTVDGAKIFDLYQKTGVPQDIILELAINAGKAATIKGFDEAKNAHSNSSKTQSEAKFKGGLADQSDQVLKYHTTTHLLNAVLTQKYGADVRQEGSNITGERLRFDFYTLADVNKTDLPQIEELINNLITKDLPVNFLVMPKAEAQTIGAKSFFREKYPDNVKVYYIGESLESAVSKEFCGGPHVTNTNLIGKISVYKLEKIGSNIYRIYAK
jgi:alanyl-tRNA synthetase